MITRIRYNKVGTNLVTDVIVINAELAVWAKIEVDDKGLLMSVVKAPGQTLCTEICTSLPQAKFRARKKLTEMGMQFNNEVRAKRGKK